jgi:peroxiredoxin
MRASARAASIVVSLAAAVACRASEPRPLSLQDRAGGPPVVFAYPAADGSASLRSDALVGRPLVLVFITTYDLASQAQARFLSMLANRHDADLSVAAIVLEPPENLPLVLTFRDALALRYPVALGDADLIAGKGPFGDVSAVPTTILIDRQGHVVDRRVGLARDTEIEQALRDRVGVR